MQPEKHLGSEHITLHRVVELLDHKGPVALDDSAKNAISKCRDYLDNLLANSDELYYGINTGFGSQYKVRVSDDEVEALQENLILSHSIGAGPMIDREVAKTIMLLKLISLSKGNSAVRLELAEQIARLYNEDLIPVIYKMGSLGASGDLAPLAHMSLALIGRGKFYADNGTMEVAPELAKREIEPIVLQSKEGLALINGTQFSTAHGLLAWKEANKLLRIANLATAYSLEAYNCNMTPFDARVQTVRGHNGQTAVAAEILGFLKGSEVAYGSGKHLQDPYAFRCVPQVHGATHDVLTHAGNVLETEINAVTDNPLVFPDTDAVISGGNFHAQPIALVLDYMSMAIHELGSISERRTYKLLSGARDLPDCLVRDAGLQSGLMIAQYSAASIVNRNKILCTPASVDSIPSSKGQEDHVSMAANAGTKLREIVQNVKTILAIEFLSATQAVELKGIENALSDEMRTVLSNYRERVAFIERDVVLHDLVVETETFFDTLD